MRLISANSSFDVALQCESAFQQFIGLEVIFLSGVILLYCSVAKHHVPDTAD